MFLIKEQLLGLHCHIGRHTLPLPLPVPLPSSSSSPSHPGSQSLEKRKKKRSRSPRNRRPAMDHSTRDILPVEDASELDDWRLPLSYMKGRHLEDIIGLPPMKENWRIKERLKTWSVALGLCLNIGVDPPDVVKTTPCARKECWIDPLSRGPQKAMELIANNLQKQYERWQPRARYKQLLDPTTDDVRKLCVALRKNAKNERVLFHYNGHGVPRPTTNGEIWVFNKSYTQYIPLSVYDLQVWMGKPSVYVLDCSYAGQIIDSFKLFICERESEFLQSSLNFSSSNTSCFVGLLDESILLAACGSKEILPMNPKLPADLFTSCLTTPIKTALLWFSLQKVGKLVHGVTEEMIDKIPGKLNDRKTPLGELNWIFTAITDTIAWNTLSQELFQKLFRQDLLVASLYRNYLLAERIMRSYNCTPESHPYLPPTYQHHLWQAWDLVVDHIMAQLPSLIDETQEYEPSTFFPEQLSAFQVWLLSFPDLSQPPTQLPIILQFLLSQAHRIQALELLGRYLDMGPEAVHAALSVGIFPYVLKLLASKLRELQPILVFIWAKILSVDNCCQSDLVKDGGYKYFISVLADTTIQFEYRTMAAFILSSICNNYSKGQEVCLQGNVVAICLSQLEEPNPVLKQWLAICLGRLWQKYDAAKWCGVRDAAHDKLSILLWDEVPEVRAAAVFALGTYIFTSSNDGSHSHSDHATSIDHSVAMMLLPLVSDGSPLVRMELITALHGLILQYEREFQIAALRSSDSDSSLTPSNLSTSLTPGGWINVFIDPSSSSSSTDAEKRSDHLSPMKRSPVALSNGSVNSESYSSGDEEESPPRPGPRTQSFAPPPSIIRYHDNSSSSGLYAQIWRGVQSICSDPCPKVALKAGSIIQCVHDKIRQTSKARDISISSLSTSISAPLAVAPTSSSTSSSSTHGKSLTLGRHSNKSRPPEPLPNSSLPTLLLPSRKAHDMPVDDDHYLPAAGSGGSNGSPAGLASAGVYEETKFYEWSCKYFANSLMKQPEDCDRFSESYLQREFRFLRNHTIRAEGGQLIESYDKAKFSDQIFVNKESKTPQELKFHPYIPQLVVLHKTSWSIWDIERGTHLCTHSNHTGTSRATAVEFINPHDVSFLLTGTDDGCIRVWRNYLEEDSTSPTLLTSWRALSDMQQSSRNVGMVMEWEQPTGLLYATGDVKYIRVWDTHKEMKISDISTGAESCVSSLALDHCDKSLMVAGCGDGTVRLYDRRHPSSCSLVQVLKEHSSWILKVHVQQPVNNIVSMGAQGDVRVWDPRFTKSTHSFNTMTGSNVCTIHHSVPLLACASNQAIKLYNIKNKESINSIRYHDGFMGQKIGPTKSIIFHPYKLWMAAGGSDGLISIYSSERKK